MIRRIVQRTALRLFPFWEWLGLHVVPAHFHYPIPASGDLPDALFDRRSQCVGMDWNEPGQLALLPALQPCAAERDFPENPGLSPVDAAVLHALIRQHKPRRMIEVGSGHSTLVAAAACAANARDGHPCRLTAIDPEPRVPLLGAIDGLTEVRRQRVQDVEPAFFVDCDLLFIDSSHVAGIGSDVTYEQLEILPRLKPGCLVHFHDILLPGEYWKDWVKGRRFFWSEQYLLWAFMLFNREFEVIWAARFMQLTHAEEIARAFPFYKPEHRITSFWIRRLPA